VVRNIVDASAIRDIQDASVFEGEARVAPPMGCVWSANLFFLMAW
jgi:hypothetical protein